MDTLTSPRHLRLHTSDNVVVAVDAFQAGQHVEDVTVKDRVPRGHKLASKPIALGEPVRKFGQIIGSASKPISISAALPASPTAATKPMRAAFCRLSSRRHSRDSAGPMAARAPATTSAC